MNIQIVLVTDQSCLSFFKLKLPIKILILTGGIATNRKAALFDFFYPKVLSFCGLVCI